MAMSYRIAIVSFCQNTKLNNVGDLETENVESGGRKRNINTVARESDSSKLAYKNNFEE